MYFISFSVYTLLEYEFTKYGYYHENLLQKKLIDNCSG